MAPELVGLAGTVVLLILIALRMPIGLALGLVGLVGAWVLLGFDTMVYALGTAPVESLSSFTLSVLPLFLLMGVVAARSGFAESLYNAAYAFVGHRRGGLAMASLIACGGFGAVCGSSLATVATMGRIAVPQMLRYGYAPQLAAGSVATGATLSILIPPSLPMIIYAVLTETSIGQLFAAGIVPGVVGVAFYAITTAIWMRFRPEAGPAGDRSTWGQRLRLISGIWGVVGLFLVVLGGIFAGLFSPTEGAAVGAGGATLLGFVTRKLSIRSFIQAIGETVVLTAAILFIVIGVSLFDFFVSGAQFPQGLAALLDGLDLPRYVILAGVLFCLIILGCFLDVIAIIFVTTPVLFPVMTQLGFDPVWYGIMTMMVVEFGAVTPPIGMNIFVLTKQLPEVSAVQAFRGIVPYLGADVARLFLFIVFPGLVLWLPHMFFK